MSQPAPDWSSPAGLREHGPVRELHLCGDRCHRRGGMRLRWHCAEGQCWPQPAGTVLWGQGAAHRPPEPSGPTPVPLPKSAFPAAGLCHPLPLCPPSVCWPCWHAVGHLHGPTLLGDMLGWPPKTSSSRVFAAERVGEGLSQEPGCCRLSPRTQMPKLWGEKGSSDLAAACSAALSVLWA